MVPLRALLPLVCAFALVADDDEIVKEFKKYFKKYKDAPTRVEAILALEDVESTEVVEVLVPVLDDDEPEVVNAAVRVLGGFESRPPIDTLLQELDSAKKTQVRTGILRAIQKGKYDGTREALVPLLEDKEWDVRRRTIEALVATVGDSASEAIAPLVNDGEVAVVCAALEGLAWLRSEMVLQPAIANLANESWQVRAAAIAALMRVRHRDSIAPLIERLGIEEGRLVEDIGKALDEITGRGFGQRLDLWQAFWERYGDTFEIPTDAELARLREKQRERREGYSGAPGAVNFNGIETPSRSIIFVIDVSGSMEQEVSDRERYADGGYPSFERIDIVKTELARTIEALEPYVKFNILAFATDVRPWKKSLVAANPLNKSSAASFISKLEAIGGSSKEDLAAAGLTGAANLEAGKTNTHGALTAAIVGDGKPDDYEVEVDTIFFLSDGRPSTGKFIDTDDILRDVAEANALRKIVIHTLAIGEFEKEFMKRLAAQNGGVFVDLGK